MDAHQAVNLSLYTLLGLIKLGTVGGDVGPDSLVGEVVLDGVGQHEVAVGQTLHKSRSTQTVCTVVREVALADGEQTCDRGHQLIIDPDATHCVVDSGVDHHRVVVSHAVDLVGLLAGVNVGDLLVHVEEVAVALTDNVDAEAVDRLREVEEHSQTGVVHAEALVATLLSGARSHVTGNEVTEGGIAALQIVVAVFLRNV